MRLKQLKRIDIFENIHPDCEEIVPSIINRLKQFDGGQKLQELPLDGAIWTFIF
jgi:hypothetical protein